MASPADNSAAQQVATTAATGDAPGTLALETAASVAALAAHWRATRRLTGWLLAFWFGMTVTIIVFARELDGLTVLGWPVSFYLAAQGATLGYLALVALYAWRMSVFDRRARSSDPAARGAHAP